MATIYLDDEDDKYAFNRHAFNSTHWRDRDFLETVSRRAEEFESSLSSRARGYYESFDDNSRLSFDIDEFIDRSRRSISLTKTDLSRFDGVIPLETLAQIQRPPKVMQAFILAEPTIAREFRAKRVQGYLLDPEKFNPLYFKDEDGEYDEINDPFFKQVNVGRVVETKSGSYLIGMHCMSSNNPDAAPHIMLTDGERKDVQAVWRRAMNYHEEAHDVTSPAGAKRY